MLGDLMRKHLDPNQNDLYWALRQLFQIRILWRLFH